MGQVVDSRGLVRESGLPGHEAERLLQKATGRSRGEIVVGVSVDEQQRAIFESYVRRRLANEPLQYIEGDVPFGPVMIAVDERVLVPRPETEELFELVLSLVTEPSVIFDVCTGSGNLAVALAATFQDAEVFASDISGDAVDVALANVEANGVDVSVFVGDLFAPFPERLAGKIDIIVANPPYLADAELASVPADVLLEPHGALTAGPKGDEILARIAADVAHWLAPGGLVVCEISEFHGARIEEHFAHVGGRVVKDLFGKDRFVVGWRSVD